MTRYFKVTHKAGAFIEGIHYPCADDQDDATDSIVPLELKKGEKAPLWGVEVDAHGNEIGEHQTSARDRLGDQLGNQIAEGAGVGAAGTSGRTGVDINTGAGANGTKQEAEQRKQTIVDTLALLDHDKDDDWNKADGKPKVDVVAAASGLEGLTRAEIDEAAPDFKRNKAE